MPSEQPRRSARLRQNGDSTTQPSKPQRSRQRKQRPIASISAPSKSPETNGQPEDPALADDDLCPICQLLLYRPVTTTCNHTMCESCMAHWADVSVQQQMTIVDVDEEPVAFNPVTELEAKCPMCRTQTTAALDVARLSKLKETYPRTWRERQNEEEENESAEGSIQTLTVYVGNRHQLVASDDANKHEWTFFVKPSRRDIIEEVQIQLHPTFRPNLVIRQRPPYEICRYGWGTFTLVAYVILKAGYTWVSSDAQDSPDGALKGMLPLDWTLDFDGFDRKGSMGRCRLKVKNDRDWQSVSSEEERDDREWQRIIRQYQRDGRYEPPEED